MMMKLILAVTLLVAVTIAAPGSPKDKLIADYCAGDDAAKDAILVTLEGWCLKASVSFKIFEKITNSIMFSFFRTIPKQKLSVMKLEHPLRKLTLTKLSSDKDLRTESVRNLIHGIFSR